MSRPTACSLVSAPVALVAALVAGVLAASSLVAPSASAQPRGELSSFPFLQFEPSARAAAMGGAFGAVADGDVNALFYNPAVPGPASAGTPSLTYVNHVSDVNAGSVAYSRTIRGLGTTASGAVRFAHWGQFEGRDEFGVRTGTFTAGDVALTTGLSRGYGTRWRYGATASLIYSSIADADAAALATDLGVLYRIPARQFAVGASVRHLGVALDRFGQSRPDLPLDVQVSLSKRLAHLPLLISLTGYDLQNLDDGVLGGSTFDHVLGHLALGGEFQLGDHFRARFGYNHRRSKELALRDRLDLAGLSLGFGLIVSRLTVDYAYSSWSDLGGLHQFTLRVDV
jgi:hypothetical protein